MFETVKRIYGKTGNTAYVENAVKKGWITAEQYRLITGEAYEI